MFKVSSVAARSFGQKVIGACCGGNTRTQWWIPGVKETLEGLYQGAENEAPAIG